MQMIENIQKNENNPGQQELIRYSALLKNNTVLFKEYKQGTYEPLYVSNEFAVMMESDVDSVKDRLLGRGFFKIIYPSHRPFVRSMLKHGMNYKGEGNLSIQLVTAKKHMVWVDVHFAFIEEFGEKYIYCTYTDISALKDYEDRMRSIYSIMGQSFYQRTDATLAMLRINLTKDSIEETKGRDIYPSDAVTYSYTESMMKRLDNYLIPSERNRYMHLFDRWHLIEAYNDGITGTSMILYCTRPGGRACYVSISAEVTRHPLSGDMMAFFTERECNTEKVNEVLQGKILAQQFDMVAYLTGDRYGVTIGDEGLIKYGSIFPATKNGVYETYLKNQVYPALVGTTEDKRRVLKSLSMETVEEQLKENEPYVVNIEIEMEGETYYKRFDFYRADPDADFYILLKSDTTEIQKKQIAANEQLKEALEAANQANVAKTAFLSSMSHEIRTPMNAIIGLDSIALRDESLSNETRDHLEKIGGSARHLLSLINDILDMSRIESGRMTIKNEEFSFGSMLEQINTMIGSQCSDKGLIYDCRIIGHVSDYYIGDEMKLKQVIINILGNSVKFTPEGGMVTFVVEALKEYEGQTSFRFTMKDTGIGMDKSYLPKIFEAFSQENSSNTNKYGSTGLGMAITKNIVELMNGNISVDSEKGVGTIFTVELFLRNSERSGKDASTITPHDLKVLVIDDDPIALDHARIVLEEIGVAADICTSGEEALELIRLKSARRDSYNLIFVDWKMPERDGMEVTRDIRGIIGSDSAVIILTAYDWTDIEDEAKAAGVDSFMSKPIFASNVLSAFRGAIENKKTSPKDTGSVDLAGRRILLAEDMIINAEIIREVLKMEKMETELAENGQIALDMFASHPSGYYDAILMDIRMPVMDGLTATEHIRALDREDAKTVPIIALTANAFDEDVQHSLQAGMDAHLSKPVEPPQLYATLADLIRDE